MKHIAEQLLDSKRFCDLLAMASQFKKRTLTQDDKVMILVPMLMVIADKMGQAPVAPVVKERPGPAQQTDEKAPLFDMGQLGEQHDLPFDPFMHPSEQGKEPDVVQTRLAGLKMLEDALAKANAPVGKQVTVMMDTDWNANDAGVFFSALEGRYTLSDVSLGSALNSDGSVMKDGGRAQGWRVKAIRNQ